MGFLFMIENTKPNNYTKKVAQNVVVQIVGKVTTTAISLILIAALTRYLGVAGYGAYTTVFAYVSFFAVFADLGFFWIMIREISKPKADVTKITNNIMTLRAVLGALVFLLGFAVSWLIPSYGGIIRWGIGICSFGWFWISLNSTYVGVFQSKHRMDKSVISEVVGRIVILVFVLMFIKFDYGLLTIIAAYTIGNLANFILSIILGWRLVPFKLAFDFPLWRKMFHESWPMGIVLVLGVIVFRIDTVMLSIMKTQTDVGIYGAPYKVMEILVLIPSIFMGNVFPIITKYYSEQKDKLQNVLQKSFDFLMILAAPLLFGTIILAVPVIRFVAGDEFITATTLPNIFGYTANSALALQFLIFAGIIMFFSIMFNNTAVAIGRQRDLIKPYIFFVGVNIGLNFILIPRLSYIGASISTVITELLVLIFTALIVYKHIKPLKIKKNIIPKTIFASVMMSILLIFVISSYNVVLQSALAVATYFAVLYLIKGFTKDDLKLIINKRE